MFRSPIPRSNAHFLHQDSVSKYFDSEHYENLDYIQRRKIRRDTEDSESTSNSTNAGQIHSPSQTESDPLKGGQKKRSHFVERRAFGLRRPLSPSVTLDDIREQSICHEEFAEKPFSTVVSTSGPMSYADCFPLLMARSSEAEEKDVTKVQTETRRKSVVSTDYHSGKIHLKGLLPSQDVKLNVFPLLHTSLSSDEEEEDENEPVDIGKNNVDDKPEVPMYIKMSSSSTSNSGLSRGWGLARKKLPLLTGKRSNQVRSRSFGRSPQKITRRRSVDSNAICSEHFRALQIIRDRMRASAFEEEEEDDEEEDQSASLTEEDEYHLKHAKSTMLHLDKNLKTLEKFLSQIDSSLDKKWSASSMQNDGGIPYSFREAEEIATSSESDDEDATFW